MANSKGTNMLTVLEHCRVSPTRLDHNSITRKNLPLTFFDIFWLNWPSSSLVYFYDFPCSKSEFTQTIVPCLKNSLAIALQYYFPLCGNLIIPATLSKTTTIPAIICLDGDSVSLTIAEFSSSTSTISEGFKHLSGNHARHVDELFGLVPQLLPGDVTETGADKNVVISPVFAVQLTLFPDHGFTVGLTRSHVVVDGKTMSSFMRTWASVCVMQLNDNENDYNYDHINNNLPFYDRSVIKDTKGIASIFLRGRLRMAETNSKAFAPQGLEKDTVQATFKMNRAQIQGLKNLVSAQVPHVSTFVVVCAYVWTCMTKARAALGQDQKNDDFEVEEHFFIGMDTRARLDPPIPSNYFGNAILTCKCTLKSSQLLGGGEEGFVNAVEEIRKTLDGKTSSEEGVLKGFEMFFDHIDAMKGQRKFGVSGSPKFDDYGLDFGWGKPKKFDFVSKKFSLAGTRDSNGDLEIGLCFSKDEMDAFTTIFTQGLIN
ncbi:Anthocyanin 5-aromatic acyltransferase [Heracleum sosnowskyi]|uniref:Anthocyanin 5-aromatic acyltransferase n=1 Tax=Heracleum sosnowskyi TaxID=360622 RepID=A0AAD8HJA6_9APIA|nr:Anthocyanin 5-aromatic acyltransferase [Heracleum sosnowskyi]